MNIQDLGYLQVADETVQGGWGYYSYYQNDKVKLDIKTNIDLEDNSAEAFADSAAYGKKTFSKTVTFAYADEYNSVSSSASFAAED